MLPPQAEDRKPLYPVVWRRRLVQVLPAWQSLDGLVELHEEPFVGEDRDLTFATAFYNKIVTA